MCVCDIGVHACGHVDVCVVGVYMLVSVCMCVCVCECLVVCECVHTHVSM